ncbi:MAG TPA: VOC family protein, partial [Stellaceae bacterium]|nr:VOC family protein [Stellaceae bacterium]
TRAFYEDFLGLRLVSAFELEPQMTQGAGRALHTFFEMDDGSCLAFFEAPGAPFEFKAQNPLDLHIALGVEAEVFEAMLDKGKAQGREVHGPIDHGFVRSIYFRDPNGYIVELTTPTGVHEDMMDPEKSQPHRALEAWQASKSR